MTAYREGSFLDVALALAVMSNGVPRKKPRLRKYSEPLGPPKPMSRQHLRAMKRASEKAKRP